MANQYAKQGTPRNKAETLNQPFSVLLVKSEIIFYGISRICDITMYTI